MILIIWKDPYTFSTLTRILMTFDLYAILIEVVLLKNIIKSWVSVLNWFEKLRSWWCTQFVIPYNIGDNYVSCTDVSDPGSCFLYPSVLDHPSRRLSSPRLVFVSSLIQWILRRRKKNASTDKRNIRRFRNSYLSMYRLLFWADSKFIITVHVPKDRCNDN